MNPLLLLLLLPLFAKGGGLKTPGWPGPMHPPPNVPKAAPKPAAVKDAGDHMKHPPAHPAAPKPAAAAARKLVPKGVHSLIPRIP